MSDDPPPTAPMDRDPEVWIIPPENIRRWTTEINRSHAIGVPFFPSDIDNLYFAIQKLGYAGAQHLWASQCFHGGKPEDGNAALDTSRRFTIEALNHLAQFMSAIMARATELPDAG